MTLDSRLLEILACPADKGPLLYFADDDLLYNPRRKLAYRVDDGIPVMLIDEATHSDAAEHGRLMDKARAEGISFTFDSSDASDAPGGRSGGD